MHVSYGRMIIATRLHYLHILVKQHNQNARLVLKFLTTRILDLTEAATWTEVGHHTMLPPPSWTTEIVWQTASSMKGAYFLPSNLSSVEAEDSISPMISEMNHASHLEE